MQKFLWSVYVSASLAVLGLVLFAQDCPQNGGCWSCYETLLGCATNGNGHCSSNCVRMSPSDCTNFTTNAISRLDTIDSSVESIRNSIISFDQNTLQDELFPVIRSAITNVNEALTSLRNFNPTNDVVQLLQSSLTPLEFVIERVSPVEQISGVYYYSNTHSHVSARFLPNSRIGVRLSLATNSIHQAIDSYGRLESDIINTHSAIESYLTQAVSDLQTLEYNLLASWTAFRAAAEEKLTIVEDSSTLLRSDVLDISCESCGSGGGSGAGGAGGGGGTDFTGAESKLAEIEALLRRVYDLIYNYYTDYNYARDRPVSQSPPSYQDYHSLGDNWFQRVEYLLYTVSPLVPTNELEGADNPELIEGQTAYENNVAELESTVTEQEQSLTSKATQPMESLKASFTRLWSKLSVFKSPIDNPNDPLLWSHITILEYRDPGSDGFRLEAANESEGVTDTFVKLQIGFRFLWFLLTVALYIYFTIAIIKFSFKVGSFVVKILNSSFGSS